MTTRLIFALLLLMPALATAAVRPEATVTGTEVMLSDLFFDVPFEKDKAVVAAPAPGRQLVFEGRQLAGLAKNYGLTVDSPKARVVITRASQRYGRDELAKAMTEQLGGHGKTDVLLDNNAIVLHAPVDRPTRLVFSNMLKNGNRFSAVAQLLVDDRVYAQSPVSGRLREMVSLPVLNRNIQKGEIISAADIGWQDIEAATALTDAISDADNLIGKAPRNALRAGVPLRSIDLLTPALVNKGAQVTLVYRTAGVEITSPGRVLNDGAAGDTVRVVNLMSSRTIEGTVLSNGMVRVGPTMLTQAALADNPVN